MLAFKLAFRNLIGAGLRTWLNVAILSFAFVLIIFYGGMLDGWNRQGIKDTKEWKIGEGQFWHPKYDQLDPFTIQDSHAPLSGGIQKYIKEGTLSPILITEATAYPQGRVRGVVLKGIDPGQSILKLPVSALKTNGEETKAIIGKRMAESMKLNVGDNLLVRWRDINGTFDAIEIQIEEIFRCNVPPVDNGTIYLSIDVLREMTNMPNEATLIVTGKNYDGGELDNWVFKDEDFLLADFHKLIASKKGGASILQIVLLILALLAIFDTQVLSIFRRQKEIGTFIAMGMTRRQVVGIFTVEGAAHSILAAVVGAAYGIPLFLYLNKIGISFGTPDMGITIAETIYPYYSIRLIIISIFLVVGSATIVSYLPARRIAKMKPTDALKGKLQ
ncbi:MAG: FtsX-like permease family protein [Bacteroidota bacterium]